MLIVIVAGGPDKGRIYELDGARPVVIGREGAEIRLNDLKVSRRHARLWCEGGRWYAQDFNSRFGTHRNDSVIEGKHPLNDGDRLRVGSSLLVVTRKVSVAEMIPEAPDEPQTVEARAAAQRPRSVAWTAGAAAATVLIGLNLASLLTQQRTAREIDAGLDQTRTAVTTGVTELRGFVADTPEVRQAIERLADDTGRRLDVATAALERQAQGDAALAQDVKSVYALQQQGDTQVAQLAGAVSGVQQQLGSLDVLHELEDWDGLQQATQLAAEITALRSALTQPNNQDAALASIESRLDELAVKIGAAAPAGGLETVASALEELRRDGAANTAALSQALAPRLDALAQRLDVVPGENAIALRMDEGFTRLAADLSARPDAGLIREQLSAVLDQRDASTAAIATDDPILGQVLAELQTLRNDNRRLDARLAALRAAPFENRAMLDEALATLGRQDQATQTAVAQLLDTAMAELRGKSITDADQLRRLINREVVAAVEKNLQNPAQRSGLASSRRSRAAASGEERLTRTEAAYRLAFESGRKVAIGTAVIDPATGISTPGRTLDPGQAKARGLDSWRDWYLMDDLAARKQARDAAEAVARRDRSRRTGVLQLPGQEDINVNANTAE